MSDPFETRCKLCGRITEPRDMYGFPNAWSPRHDPIKGASGCGECAEAFNASKWCAWAMDESLPNKFRSAAVMMFVVQRQQEMGVL